MCGCGHSDDVTKFVKHVCYVHTGNIPKGSSHIILSLKPAVSRSGPGFNFSLPTKVPMIDPIHLFVCPCRPIKRYQYDKFIEHVLIKHGGKVPSFIMRKSKLNRNWSGLKFTLLRFVLILFLISLHMKKLNNF